MKRRININHFAERWLSVYWLIFKYITKYLLQEDSTIKMWTKCAFVIDIASHFTEHIQDEKKNKSHESMR